MVVTVLILGTAHGAQTAKVGFIKIDGAIGPATASYIARAIELSGERNDACLIIQLDTPGGLLESTKQIARTFYASKVPTVVYVSPTHASAGSAGVFITMAAFACDFVEPRLHFRFEIDWQIQFRTGPVETTLFGF